MPTYKLTYFNGRGRGELCRLLFAAAGMPYEDVRVELDEWPTVKSSMMFGQMPILEVDGVKMCQSITIARYLAKQFGLAGKTSLDQLRADMIVDCIEDCTVSMRAFIFEPDATKKAEMQKKFREETLPPFLEKLEKLLVDNKNGDCYFVGNELTWADVQWVNRANWMHLQAGATFDRYPKLKALIHRVESSPKIAEWITKRPPTAL